MKRIVLIAACLSLSWALNCSAADATATTPETKKEGAKEKPVPAAVLKKYDKNKDGKLDDQEKAAWKADQKKQREEQLKKYDKNKDGKLDAEEKAAMKEDLKKKNTSGKSSKKNKKSN
jgi:hypothetical protein